VLDPHHVIDGTVAAIHVGPGSVEDRIIIVIVFGQGAQVPVACYVVDAVTVERPWDLILSAGTKV
jgi:hypothetical protein